MTIFETIQIELSRGESQGEHQSESLRWAAAIVMEEMPSASSRDFCDAAEKLGLRRNSCTNRWNEAKKNMAGYFDARK